MSEDADDQSSAMAQAYFILGRLFNKQGDHMQSEKYYEQYLKLCVEMSARSVDQKEGKKTGNLVDDGQQKTGAKVEEVGLAKMLLGIARGNAQMKHFFSLVSDESKIMQLLEFKSRKAEAAAM